MAYGGEVEIGWKKELLEDQNNDKRETSAKKSNSNLGSADSSSNSSSSSSDDDSSDTSDDNRKKRREQKREKRREYKLLKKEKKKLEKIQKKEAKRAKKEKRKEEKRLKKLAKKVKNTDEAADCSIPIDLMYTKSHAPETRAEYETRQNHIRRVQDPVTGRLRLIKGDGEILEEIVSKKQHKEINMRATQEDGNFFQSKSVGLYSSSKKK